LVSIFLNKVLGLNALLCLKSFFLERKEEEEDSVAIGSQPSRQPDDIANFCWFTDKGWVSIDPNTVLA